MERIAKAPPAPHSPVSQPCQAAVPALADMSPGGMAQRSVAEAIAHSPVQRRSSALDRHIQTSPRMAAQRRQFGALRGEAAGADGVVQRDVENDHYDESDADGAALARQFFAGYNSQVQLAYQFAVTVPSLGPRAGLNGYTELWSRLWAEHLAGKQPKLLAAAFGYVIESLVTYDAAFKPAPPGGCSVLPQVVSGGTRPDLVLVLAKDGASIAWLDLTASQSADHIFDKDNWAAKTRHFAEVTYPSLDLATLALMKQNRDNVGPLTQEEFETRRAAAQEEYQKNKTRWLELGAQFTIASQRSALAKAGLSNEMRGLQPERPREFVRQLLVKAFDTEIDIKLVPSILVALGVQAVSWGYQIGFGQSEKAGEAWLIDHAPGA